LKKLRPAIRKEGGGGARKCFPAPPSKKGEIGKREPLFTEIPNIPVVGRRKGGKGGGRTNKRERRERKKKCRRFFQLLEKTGGKKKKGGVGALAFVTGYTKKRGGKGCPAWGGGLGFGRLSRKV